MGLDRTTRPPRSSSATRSSPVGGPVDRQASRSGWARIRIACVENLRDAVYGAGLTVAQMSHAPITGSLAFAVEDGVTDSSGLIEGRVALRGALSERMVTVGTGLTFAPGTRQWLNEVVTGEVGVFLAGDEHDAFYTPSTLYATATLEIERLEQLAAREDLVLDARTLGGSGIATGRIAESALAWLRKRFERVHGDIEESSTTPRMLDETVQTYVRKLSVPFWEGGTPHLQVKPLAGLRYVAGDAHVPPGGPHRLHPTVA